MNHQLDFFGDAGPPKGMTYIPEFISVSIEKNLIENIRDLEWHEYRMHGVVARRKIAPFRADLAPEFIRNLLPSVASAMKLKEKDIAEILVTHYPVDAPIGWHRDLPQYESLLGISLGNNSVMKFRLIENNKKQFKQIPERRSAYILKDEARWDWHHHIPPVKEERFSITFRNLVQ